MSENKFRLTMPNQTQFRSFPSRPFTS